MDKMVIISGSLSNKKISIGLKCKLCKIVVRPAKVYGSEYWSVDRKWKYETKDKCSINENIKVDECSD